MRKWIALPVLLLMLATLACSVHIPVTQIKTGPERETDINVPLPEDGDTVVDVKLVFGAGTLELNPGAEEALISGTATYNVEDFKPSVKISGGKVAIEQGSLNVGGIPSFQGGITNEWDLSLGETPMTLVINAGAYTGEFELGGLALQFLQIGDGAADVNLSFSEPNLIEMETFRYETGASDVTLTGLANANFAEMVFRGGAGTYELDFSGTLQRNADVSIESGMSSITVIVPEDTAVEVTYEGALSEVELSGNWEQRGDKYVQPGDGPLLTISIKTGAGEVNLRNP